MSIKSPAQALEHIRALCVAPSLSQPSLASFAESVLAAAQQGLAATPADLTPAQQHAEDLLAAARDVLHQARTGVTPLELGFLRGAVEAIDPPEPPTLEEALELLRDMTTHLRPNSPYAEQAQQRAIALLARVPQ